jgi:hypothetical protein
MYVSISAIIPNSIFISTSRAFFPAACNPGSLLGDRRVASWLVRTAAFFSAQAAAEQTASDDGEVATGFTDPTAGDAIKPIRLTEVLPKFSIGTLASSAVGLTFLHLVRQLLRVVFTRRVRSLVLRPKFLTFSFLPTLSY